MLFFLQTNIMPFVSTYRFIANMFDPTIEQRRFAQNRRHISREAQIEDGRFVTTLVKPGSVVKVVEVVRTRMIIVMGFG